MRAATVTPGLAVAQTTAGARLAVDPALGNIRTLSLVDGERLISPLHQAPWLHEPEVQADETLLPVERKLSGDFFCMPFGASDLDDAPAHGWPANSAWDVVPAMYGELCLMLKRRVQGAGIAKYQCLAPDAPLLYQFHIIEGGAGGVTLAHHPMIHMADGGTFFTSPKRLALTPDTPLEPGRNRLACGARTSDLTAIPAEGGGTVDLTDLPIGTAHEDFVTLIEAPGAKLGWSAVIRRAENDIVLVLKDPRVLPITMLWHSNAGRDYGPWKGRHTGVLGIEDGIAAGAAGHRAALGPNPIADLGIPTALTLAEGKTHRIAHVIGAIDRPAHWQRVEDIRIDGSDLVIEGDQGPARRLSFQPNFLSGET